MRYFNLLCLTLLISTGVFAQKNYTISGYIKDSATGETLIGATIKLNDGAAGAATNAYGYYSVSVKEGRYKAQFTYVGYQSKTVYINVNKSVTYNVTLSEAGILANEVVITGEREDKNIKSTEMSRIELSGEKIKSLPVILGEPDLLKAITLLPGIKSGGEASTGFYVRGGGPDQNLILMDEAVVYNPSHLFGFVSVFNTDAVKSLDIIKGGMPANYGGRLSSILNVTMREGNNQKYEANGGIGLISSRLTLEGPIQKGKSSFMISGRRSYIDAIAKVVAPERIQGSGYYFYDLNLKANVILTEKDRLFVSAYFGRDIFNFTSPINKDVRFNFGWGNTTATLRWNRIISPKLFANTSLIYSRYDLFNKFEFGNNGFNVQSNLEDINLKSDFTWYAHPKHNIKFGANYIFHTFQPGIATGSIGSTDVSQSIRKQYAHEGAVYFTDEWSISQRLTVNAGLRGVFFNLVGPYVYDEFNTETNLPTGNQTVYSRGQSIAFYPRLEPRLAGTFLLNESSSIKASYTQTYQFLHLATTSGAQFPVDLWVPSSQLVKPQEARQYAIGYFKNLRNNEYESSVEAYYKPMMNQIEFKPGANLFFNQNLEQEMVFGQGLSYGVEFFLRKKTGRLNGWIGYTWSRTTRQFDELNNGKAYFYRYDRTHDMSLVLSYALNKKWNFSFVFVYGTGQAVTLPLSRYAYRIGFDQNNNRPDFAIVDVYDEINAFRLPAYHRADVSFTYIHKKTERWESSWNFSVYNIYNRANPYFIYFIPDVETQTVKASMVYLFPILPSIQWNFKF